MKKSAVVIIVIGGFLIVSGFFYFGITAGMGDIKKMTINDVDLSKISDGTYAGSFHRNRWNYDLNVIVKEHRIIDVQITNKKMDTYKRFNENAVKAIIENQSPKIDVITGASVHTKAFSKAVENALTGT